MRVAIKNSLTMNKNCVSKRYAFFVLMYYAKSDMGCPPRTLQHFSWFPGSSPGLALSVNLNQ